MVNFVLALNNTNSYEIYKILCREMTFDIRTLALLADGSAVVKVQ